MAPRFSLVWRGPGGREDRHLDDDRGVDEVVCAERRRERLLGRAVIEDLRAEGGRGAAPARRGGDRARPRAGAVGLLEADDVADVADLLFVVVIYEERDGLAVRKKAQRIGSVEPSAGSVPVRVVVPLERADRRDLDQGGVRRVALPRRAGARRSATTLPFWHRSRKTSSLSAVT